MNHYEIFLWILIIVIGLYFFQTPTESVFLVKNKKEIPVELLCSSFFNGEFIFGEGLTGELTFWYVWGPGD